MGNLERLAIGVSSIGGVTGIGVFLNKSLSNEDIRSKLQANNFKILNNNDQYGTWEKILQVYKTLAQESKFKFADNNINNKEDLQKQCKIVFEKKLLEDNESNNYFDKAKRWCTVPTSVSKELEKERKLLNTEQVKDDPDNDAWDKKIKEYIANKKEEEKIKNLVLESKTPPPTDEKNIQKIKNKCKELNLKESYDEDYEEALKKSRTWCTTEKKTPENK